MGRLQVGDIRIDGRNVTIGGVAPAAASSPLPPPSGPDLNESIRLLDRVPFSPGFLAATGLVCAAFGTAANVLLAAWDDPLRALLGGGFLAPLGVALLALAGAKALLRARPDARHRAALANPAPFLNTLRQLLARDREEQTVDWIRARTGWTDEQVVHALALLRASDELREELDLETGQFYYVAQPIPIGPRDLDTRLGQLTP